MEPINQIPPGYWGTFRSAEGRPPLFGLKFGQLRAGSKCFHNGVWYNAFGQKVGFGDLNRDDLERIMREIKDGCYLIIAAQDHKMKKPALDPGIEEVITHAELLITRGQMRAIIPERRTMAPYELRGLTLATITFAELRTLLLPLQRLKTNWKPEP